MPSPPPIHRGSLQRTTSLRAGRAVPGRVAVAALPCDANGRARRACGRGQGAAGGHHGRELRRGQHTHITSCVFRAAGAPRVDVRVGAPRSSPVLLGAMVDAVVQLRLRCGDVKGGQVRLLATIASGRDPAFPDVPTAR